MNENKVENMNYNNIKNNKIQPQPQPNNQVQNSKPAPLPNNVITQNIPTNLNRNTSENFISQQIAPQTMTPTLNQSQPKIPINQNQNRANSQYSNNMNPQKPQMTSPINQSTINQKISQMPFQTQNNTQQIRSLQLNKNAPKNITIDPSQQKEETESANNVTKKLLRKIFLTLMLVGLIITIIAIYLLIDDNNKYQNYTITVADLVDYDKVEKNGLVYYSGNYKYKVNRKEYFYTPKELSQTIPNSIIQLKYNAENPNKVYEKNMSRYFFIILFTGLGISFLSGIAVVAFTSSKTKEIITVQVIEQVNCVGGKRIYLDNTNINPEDETLKNEKYYVYFTNDTKKFALGNKLAFNIFKYGETFTTEDYKNIKARTIYEFKDDDFTIVNTTTTSKQ